MSSIRRIIIRHFAAIELKGTTMHSISGNQQSVESVMQGTLKQLQQNSPEIQQIIADVYQTSGDQEVETHRQQAIAQLKNGLMQVQAEAGVPPGQYASRNPVVGLVQSSISSEAQEQDLGDALPPEAEPYGPGDVRWAECVLEGLKTRLEGKWPFVENKGPSDFLAMIPSECTIALVADWGADNDRAQRVANQILALNPMYAIHLGDIYYAGTGDECDQFLKHWPLRNPVTGRPREKVSFSLNGNHEMFCGARYYFSKVLPAFGQPASYFGLMNQYWQFLGLDTAYIDHRLPSDGSQDARLISQWNWLVNLLNNNVERKSILLTHHQPVSAYHDEYVESANLRDDVTKLLAATRHDAIFGWFFGHEHRCTIYADASTLYKARLIGNGCIPHAPQTATPAPSGLTPFTKVNTGEYPAGSGEAISGFALLTLKGPEIQIAYINEDGTPFYEETWTHS
jgi:hypothetical protein